MFAINPFSPDILIFNILERKRPHIKNEIAIKNQASITSDESLTKPYMLIGNSIFKDYKL
jgi:hypothetical protein